MIIIPILDSWLKKKKINCHRSHWQDNEWIFNINTIADIFKQYPIFAFSPGLSRQYSESLTFFTVWLSIDNFVAFVGMLFSA